eukprot:4350066-Alexandrium_andersonii.AAC.1
MNVERARTRLAETSVGEPCVSFPASAKRARADVQQRCMQFAAVSGSFEHAPVHGGARPPPNP